MKTTAPLFVDLDGTLIQTDLLVESFIGLLKRHPLLALQVPFWLLRGKAYLKHRIAERIVLNPAALPYHAPFLEYLTVQRETGRPLYLATASNRRYAEAVAEHLGIFDGVLASDHARNLSGHNKLDAIREHCPEGFAYAGNDCVDEPIWASAHAAVLVNAPAAVAARVTASQSVEAEFAPAPAGLKPWLKAIRPHQRHKNTGTPAYRRSNDVLIDPSELYSQKFFLAKR